MDWRVELGLAMVLVLVWILYAYNGGTKSQAHSKHHPSASELHAQFRARAPTPLAKGKRRLVKCSVATKSVPMYKRSVALHTEAQRLATSVAVGKLVIAKHMTKGSLEVCSSDCDVRTVIAGVVRDRQTLKRLEYDQPF